MIARMEPAPGPPFKGLVLERRPAQERFCRLGGIQRSGSREEGEGIERPANVAAQDQIFKKSPMGGTNGVQTRSGFFGLLRPFGALNWKCWRV